MAPSLFPPSPGPLSHTNTQCTALCMERETIECALRHAFGRTKDRSHGCMHDRAREHASFLLTSTRSLRRWRKYQNHHTFVNHTCDKRDSGMCQSAARLAVGVRDSLRSAVVHHKTPIMCRATVRSHSHCHRSPSHSCRKRKRLPRKQPIKAPFAMPNGGCCSSCWAVRRDLGSQPARVLLPRCSNG